MDPSRRDIDARPFYRGLADPDLTFNQTEITLSHLFREPLPVLRDRTYSDRLFSYLKRRGYLREEIVEIGGGLGDVARNYLLGCKSDPRPRYTMFDISPKLLARQKERLQGLAADFREADCQQLSAAIPQFNGMVLSNGVIADLRSVYVSREYPVASYGKFDDDLAEFAHEWGKDREGWYFHVGTLLLLREISNVLLNNGTAAILEYAATPTNQPSWFDTHFECGIDFDQVASYARRIGFACEIVPIEKILGIRVRQRFLTTDVFVDPRALVHEFPGITRLWKAKRPLPVLAYTPEHLRDVLQDRSFELPPAVVKSLLKTLDPLCFTIHEPGFSTKNPTTWGYQAILLRKVAVGDWAATTGPTAVSLIARMEGIPEAEARARWERATNPQMGLDPHTVLQMASTMGIVGKDVVAALIAHVCYECVREFGKNAWHAAFLPLLIGAIERMDVPSPPKNDWLRVLRATRGSASAESEKKQAATVRADARPRSKSPGARRKK